MAHKFDHGFADFAKFDKFFVGADQLHKKLTDMTTQTVELASKYPHIILKK